MKTITETLDISILPPHKKCLAVFNRYDALRQGESFIIGDDQDPVNLYHHLLEVRAEPFSWERIENGPLWWQVRITKAIPEEGETTIGEIASHNYQKAEVFRRLGINYCCSGHKTLKEACAEAGISPEILEQFYAESSKHRLKEVHAFDKWETGFLADYILNTHHTYVKRNIETLNELALAAAQEQGHDHPELFELSERLGYFLSGLADHMRKEEQVLFPLIKKLTLSKKRHKREPGTLRQEIKGIIQKLENEHQLAGNDLLFFKKITRNYRLPLNSCDSCTFLYAKLLEFENDLVQHIHLENNLLFPKAVALEKELAGTGGSGFVRQIYQTT